MKADRMRLEATAQVVLRQNPHQNQVTVFVDEADEPERCIAMWWDAATLKEWHQYFDLHEDGDRLVWQPARAGRMHLIRFD